MSACRVTPLARVTSSRGLGYDLLRCRLLQCKWLQSDILPLRNRGQLCLNLALLRLRATTLDPRQVVFTVTREHGMLELQGEVVGARREIRYTLETVDIELPNERAQVVMLEVGRKYVL